MKKKSKNRFKPSRTWGGATTTSWDWGFKPVPNKGGKTVNGEISEKKGKGE